MALFILGIYVLPIGPVPVISISVCDNPYSLIWVEVVADSFSIPGYEGNPNKGFFSGAGLEPS